MGEGMINVDGMWMNARAMERSCREKNGRTECGRARDIWREREGGLDFGWTSTFNSMNLSS